MEWIQTEDTYETADGRFTVSKVSDSQSKYWELIDNDSTERVEPYTFDTLFQCRRFAEILSTRRDRDDAVSKAVRERLF